MSFLKLKNYTGKTPMNLLFSKISLQEISVEKDFFRSLTNIRLKIFLYTFVKLLKIYKLQSVFYSLFSYNSFGRRLQNNGFYLSLVELKKKDKLRILNDKVFHVKNFLLVQKSFQKVFLLDSVEKKKKTLKSLSKGLEKFEKYFVASSKMVSERQLLLDLLKTKIFINNVFVSRIFLSITKGRKKYRSSFSYLFRRKRKIESLLNVFTSTSLRFKDVKVQRRRNFKKLAWKTKKQRKWVRVGVGSWNLFRLRQRLSQIFYVPKHFEINYKTLGASYLGFTDFKTTNTRIPLWLNLRRLLTFLS